MMITMCEKIVMEVIWDADHDLTIDDIINEINKERAWNKKAVSAFLRRLRKKRFIIRYRHDHKIYYQALFAYEDIAPFLTIFKPHCSPSPFL